MAGERILIVEDDPNSALSIRDILEGMGYAVSALASSGAESLQKIAAHRPDLVLMDIHLRGGMDGVEAAEKIRARFDLPVVYLSGDDSEETLRRARITAPFGYLLKPFLLKDLRRTLEIALYNHTIEHKLRESEKRYHSLFDNMPVGLYRTTPAGQVLDANAALVRILGYPNREVLLAVNVVEIFVLPEERRRFQDIVAQYGIAHDFEMQLWRLDRVIIWVRDNGRAVCDAAGQVLYYEGALEDITEHKRTEEQLLQLNKAVETMPLGMTIADLNGKICYINPADARMHRYQVEELLGQNVNLLAPPELRKTHNFAEMKTWKGMIRESVNLRKDGSVFPVWLMSQMVKGPDGEPCAIVTSCEDITERKQAEQERLHLEAQLRQAQRLKALGILAGGIAHDFNNILGTILGYTEVLYAEYGQTEHAREYLQHIHQAGKRAADLVQQILTFSRSREQTLKPTLIAPLIAEALNMIRATIPANIAIQCDLQPNCRPILADAAQIHQIIVNLCINASQAMKNSGGILAIVLEEVNYLTNPPQILALTKGAYLKLTVRDTGCGMTPEVQEHIFEPFFTTKEIGEGIGLGLSVVHGIVNSHQGVITVHSEPAQGTSFQLFFPVTEEAHRQEPLAKDEALVRKHKGHILIAEDEPALAKMYAMALIKLGYQVTLRNNGLEALEAFRAAPAQFDLVLTDQAMPHITGEQLSREVLALRPDIPIILTTGYSVTISAEQAAALGIRRFLEKPVKLGVLAHIVGKLLV